MTTDAKTDHNYLRFRHLLEDIIRKVTPEDSYVITNFGNLKPQSFCTKLREAYKYLVSIAPSAPPHEYVFSWSPTAVTVRIKGYITHPLEVFEPQPQPPYPTDIPNTKIKGQLEIDHRRGVIYFHPNPGANRPPTLLRICRLPVIPKDVKFIDVTNKIGAAIDI